MLFADLVKFALLIHTVLFSAKTVFLIQFCIFIFSQESLYFIIFLLVRAEVADQFSLISILLNYSG